MRPEEKHGYHRLSEPLRSTGTVDKVIVHGRFYSDKPPVPSIILAGWYGILQVAFGLHANQRADIFVYLMVLGSSGIAYVIACGPPIVWVEPSACTPACAWGWRAVWGWRRWPAPTCGSSMAICSNWALRRSSSGCWNGCASRGRRHPPGAWCCWEVSEVWDTAIEQPTGGLLLAAIGCLVLWRRPGWTGILWLALGCLPWLALHHGVTYAIAGTWKPINAVPEHFNYPGCEFSATNMTGRWNHPNIEACISYGFRLLFSGRNRVEHLDGRQGPGFVIVNFPLHLAVLALPVVWWRGRAWRPELLALGGWCVATWWVYAALSTNFSGGCLSVRWFLPLLAVGSYVLALLVSWHPVSRRLSGRSTRSA